MEVFPQPKTTLRTGICCVSFFLQMLIAKNLNLLSSECPYYIKIVKIFRQFLHKNMYLMLLSFYVDYMYHHIISELILLHSKSIFLPRVTHLTIIFASDILVKFLVSTQHY